MFLCLGTGAGLPGFFMLRNNFGSTEQFCLRIVQQQRLVSWPVPPIIIFSSLLTGFYMRRLPPPAGGPSIT